MPQLLSPAATRWPSAKWWLAPAAPTTPVIMVSRLGIPARFVPSVEERVVVKTAMEIRLAPTAMESRFVPHVISPVNVVPAMVPEVGCVPLVRVLESVKLAILQVPAHLAAEMVYVIIVTEAC